MKYFIDTEFLEGTQDKRFLGIKYGKTKPTIDLISIGIVAEDDRRYYAISKDFNLKEAWNRYDIIKSDSTMVKSIGDGQYEVKNYWIRDNILKPIFREWYAVSNCVDQTVFDHKFTYKEFKRLLNKYGKTNKQIAEEIKEFTSKHLLCDKLRDKNNNPILQIEADATPKEFYGYYSDYDWVVFCWLFGKMIDLPKGFPMYCIDLKQELNNIAKNKDWYYHKDILSSMNYEKDRCATMDEKISRLKKHYDYPKETNKHNALADAKWNFELYKFIESL